MPSANARWYKIGDALLVLSQGDITQWSGDAIVNAGDWGGDVKAPSWFSVSRGVNAGRLCLQLVPDWTPPPRASPGLTTAVCSGPVLSHCVVLCLCLLAANERMLGGGGVDGGERGPVHQGLQYTLPGNVFSVCCAPGQGSACALQTLTAPGDSPGQTAAEPRYQRPQFPQRKSGYALDAESSRSSSWQPCSCSYCPQHAQSCLLTCLCGPVCCVCGSCALHACVLQPSTGRQGPS